VRDVFFAKVSPLADIVQLSSNSYEELEHDFKTKYAGVKAIYHSRDPGSHFGDLGEEFFKRVPASCKLVSHRKCSSPSLLTISGCWIR
jgi:glyoxylate reductase